MSFSGVKPQFLWHVNREYDPMRIFELLGVGAATFPDYSHKNRIRSGLGLNVTDMGHSMGAPMGPQGKMSLSISDSVILGTHLPSICRPVWIASKITSQAKQTQPNTFGSNSSSASSPCLQSIQAYLVHGDFEDFSRSFTHISEHNYGTMWFQPPYVGIWAPYNYVFCLFLFWMSLSQP